MAYPENFKRRPTRRLFRQYNVEGTEDLNEWRRKFVASMDPTEYTAAMELTGSWQEWLRFKREWIEFREVILPEWHVEMEIAMRSKAIKDVVNASSESPSAAKWLAEGHYKDKQRGRPTKDQVQREAKIQAGITSEVEDDVARVLGEAGSTEGQRPN